MTSVQCYYSGVIK